MSQPDVETSAEVAARPARFVLRRLLAVLVVLALVAAGNSRRSTGSAR